MNKLSYGLLSLIAIAPCSGYDLTQRIQSFWNANHSQIYPILAQLEEAGLVSYEHVPQSDKPDKKIYSITEAGKQAVREWIVEPTDPPVTRDEFTLKFFSLWLTDRQGARMLVEEKMTQLGQKECRLLKHQEKMESMGLSTDKHDDPSSPAFGPSIVIEKALAVQKAELEWCQRVLQLLAEGKQ